MSTVDHATVAMFPGQGSLTDDARDLVAETRPELLARCTELVGEDPFLRASESTALAQPAIFCASIASWSRTQPDHLLAVVGHSLGELSALAAAGVLSVDDALELVVLRGRLMEQAGASTGNGGMLALLRGTPEQAQELADRHGVTLANDNAPGQAVLSGARDALKAAAGDARALGVKAIRLDVAGAFHSPAMAGAEDELRAALNRTELHEPSVTVYSSASAAPFTDVRAELAAAVTRPVRWRETMLTLAEAGATRFVDVGPGHVLARLVAQNLPDADVVELEDHGLAA